MKEAMDKAEESRRDHTALKIACLVLDSGYYPELTHRNGKSEEELRKLFKEAFDDITERILRCCK